MAKVTTNTITARTRTAMTHCVCFMKTPRPSGPASGLLPDVLMTTPGPDPSVPAPGPGARGGHAPHSNTQAGAGKVRGNRRNLPRCLFRVRQRRQGRLADRRVVVAEPLAQGAAGLGAGPGPAQQAGGEGADAGVGV